jgi:hypothetical protein
MREGCSPATGQSIHGFLYSLGVLPDADAPCGFTYSRLQAARRAARQGELLGRAFTKVVGTPELPSPAARRSGDDGQPPASRHARVGEGRSPTPRVADQRAVAPWWSAGRSARNLLPSPRAAVPRGLVSLEPVRLEALRDRFLAEHPGTQVEFEVSTHRLVGVAT